MHWVSTGVQNFWFALYSIFFIKLFLEVPLKCSTVRTLYWFLKPRCSTCMMKKADSTWTASVMFNMVRFNYFMFLFLVGHCNPKVVNKVTEQMMTSNCNIRFLSNKLTDAAQALLATLPEELDTVLFVNSGSEANDLAMRLAKDYTNNSDIICLDQ